MDKKDFIKRFGQLKEDKNYVTVFLKGSGYLICESYKFPDSLLGDDYVRFFKNDDVLALIELDNIEFLS